MKIVIDVFGCDYPDEVIDGLAKAVNKTEDVTLIATGDKAYIEQRLKDVQFDRTRLEIIDAPEVITNNDVPINALRQKKNSSLVKALEQLRDNDEVPVMITAGSTGAMFAGAILVLGINGLDERPTLVTALPTEKGNFVCIADCGANVDCKPNQLVKFGEYASKYMQKMYNVESPKVALLSVGTEDKKGNLLTKEAFNLLKESGLNFVGNIESKTAISGDVDVIVCDGFSGNVLLKGIEGVAKTVMKMVIGALKRNADEKSDFTFVKKAFGELMQTFDFNSLAGSILLGAKKPIIKGHGSANSDTVVNTVKQAINMVKSGYVR